MLTTQIQYWTLVESKRHNLANEDWQNRSLNETVRHNIVTETETQRHNVATETYYNNLLSETTRHNLSQEDISRETNLIGWRNSDINALNAESNRMQAQAALSNAATNRFNAVTGYSLGLEANQIAQENADSNRRQAEAAESRAQTSWLDWVNSSNQTAVNAENANSNALNAMSQSQNAAANVQNAETNAQSLELQEDRFKWQKYTDQMNINKGMFDTILKGVDIVGKYATNILGH